MSQVTFAFTIDGQKWGRNELERIEYERNLHALHQRKRHGVEMKAGDSVLTDDEIDYSTAKEAWEISLYGMLYFASTRGITLYYTKPHKRKNCVNYGLLKKQ